MFLLNKAAYIHGKCELLLLTSQNHVKTVFSFFKWTFEGVIEPWKAACQKILS